MADYLTLLARRSLGVSRQVEPARVHRYVATDTPADGVMEGATIDRDPAMDSASESHRRPRGGAARPRPTDHPGAPRPPASEEGTFDRVITPASEVSPVVEGNNPVRPRRTESEPAGSPRIASATEEEIRASDLLLPMYSKRVEVEPGPESASESIVPAAETGDDRDDGRRTAHGPDNSVERPADPPEHPPAETDPEGPSTGGKVEVSIGTIEIRAVSPPRTAAIPRPRRESPKLSLDDYLVQRRRGER